MKKSELFEAALALLIILLAFTLYLAMTSGPGASGQWAISGPVAHTGFWVYDNMFTPGNGMLYTVDGSSVYAIGEDGKVNWSLPIPDKYKVNEKGEKWTGIAAAAEGGDFYVIVGPGNQPLRGQLLAIDPDGTVRWSAPLTFNLAEYYNTQPGLHVKDGRVYIHHYHNQIILDANGSLICNINGVYDPASIDDSGNMYVYSKDNGSIEAYGRDGSMLWDHTISEYNVSVLSDAGNDQPYYRNGTLYVWLTNGVMALDTSGNKLWARQYSDENTVADYNNAFDGQGNLYLRHYNNILGPDANGSGSYLSMIRPDCSEVATPMHNASYLDNIVGAYNGTYYHVQSVAPEGVNDVINAGYYKDPGTVEYMLVQSKGNWSNNRLIDQLDTNTIKAYDMTSYRELWSVTLPLFPHNIVLDASNIGSIMPPYLDLSYAANENSATPAEWYKNNSVPDGTEAVGSWVDMDFIPGNNITYVSLWTLNYEVPTFYGQSKCVYSGGIYALDKDGKLLWAKPTGARVTDMKESNGTIYYGTDDGKLSAAKVSAAAGFALTAVFYLFIRFFMAGAVTRARSRLDHNENRNVVLKFIAENPGSSLYDISKTLKMNIGTVRYHLLILSINHRVITYKSDGKHIRYFTNSGTYKAEEQSLISLMRREALRNALGALLKDPGLSNRELSIKLDMLDSATNRYMKELIERGIVENDLNADGRTSYVIKNEYREKISLLMERLNGTKGPA